MVADAMVGIYKNRLKPGQLAGWHGTGHRPGRLHSSGLHTRQRCPLRWLATETVTGALFRVKHEKKVPLSRLSREIESSVASAYGKRALAPGVVAKTTLR